MRVGVEHDPYQDRVVDDKCMRLRQHVLYLGVECLPGLVDQRVDLGVSVAAPVTPTDAIWPEGKKRKMA
jgi:hypothetical protein